MMRVVSQNSTEREPHRNAQRRGGRRADEARADILESVRKHLRLSEPHDARRAEHMPHDGGEMLSEVSASILAHHAPAPDELTRPVVEAEDAVALSRIFRERLESVGGRCYEAADEPAAANALRGIITEARKRGLKIDRVAVSNAASVAELVHHGAAIDGVSWLEPPTIEDLFACDAGVTATQYGIAETGTLVLVSDAERHRNISLVPPIHIAVLRAGDIRFTLGEALREVHEAAGGLSRAVTFITGPSRTADIELTLALGVHGPQELHVIITAEKKERCG